MGGICSCCDTKSDEIYPDAETRRQLQAESAERRRIESESRGIKVKDIDKVKRQKQRSEDQEKRDQNATKYGTGSPALKWQQD